jgi:outer membrane protein assembly factor BamB
MQARIFRVLVTESPTRVRIPILCLAAGLSIAPPHAAAQPRQPAAAQPAAAVASTADTASGFEATLELALDAQPAAPAAFDADTAYLPLKGERVVAIDLATGTIRWTIDVATTWAPAVSDGVVVVAADEWLGAFDARTGRPRWRVPVAGAFSAAPEINGGWVVAVSAGGDVYTIRAADGSVLWTRQLGSAASAPPVATATGIFVPLADSRVVALALTDGASLWERPLGGKPGPLVVLDDRLFVGGDDKYFYSLRTKDGDVRWRQRVGGRPAGAAAVDHRRVYYVPLDNILWAFDRNNGGRKWHTPLPMRPSGGPLTVGDAVIVAGIAAEVHAYRPDTGAAAGVLKWPADLAAPPQVIPSGVPSLTSIAMVTRTGVFTLISRAVEPRPTALPYPLGTDVPLSALDLPPAN